MGGIEIVTLGACLFVTKESPRIFLTSRRLICSTWQDRGNADQY